MHKWLYAFRIALFVAFTGPVAWKSTEDALKFKDIVEE